MTAVITAVIADRKKEKGQIKKTAKMIW